MSNPIADLSYRNYDGPLERPINRWWAIAVVSMRMSLKKKGFWIWSCISAWWYLMMMAIFYFIDVISAPGLGQKNPILESVVWKDQFLNAFSISQMLLFIIALLIGVGTIANDNRANALMVYLSKPVSRLDYLIGKWLGIFIPITAVVALPALAFFGYGLMSFREYGFLSEDPMLPVKLIFMVLVPGFFHASVALGISSMFNQGRLAGATYAGIYFLTLFFTKMMQFLFFATVEPGSPAAKLVSNLYYCSIDGIQIAMAKIILGTNGSFLFPMQSLNGPGGGSPKNTPVGLTVPAPDAAPFVIAFFLICAISLFVAWTRIRAVEVVGS